MQVHRDDAARALAFALQRDREWGQLSFAAETSFVAETSRGAAKPAYPLISACAS